MQVDDYLKKYQPVIYQTFVRSLETNKLSHAYLISGSQGTPLFEVAKFLAKSILCDDRDPLACGSCITCLRVDDENYPDYVIFNGQEGTIKKEDIESIETAFEKEAMEAKGIRIYLLHLIENMTTVATNSLLKFLEEPHPNIYAFLTTNNENSILPTIISRCQNFHLKSINRKTVIDDAKKMGVNPQDAEFLSFFYNEPNLICDINKDKRKYKSYTTAKNNLFSFLECLIQDKKGAIYLAQTQVGPSLDGKESLRFFLDMLGQVLEDVVNAKNKHPLVLESTSELINRLAEVIKKPNEALIEVLRVRGVVNLNVNASLIIDHIAIYLAEGDKK